MVRIRDMHYIQLWVGVSGGWSGVAGPRAARLKTKARGRRHSSQWIDWMKGRWTDSR